jgi:hypothetical protein
MKWVWLAGDGCFELNLKQVVGFRIHETAFGYVNAKNYKAYDTWSNECIGQFESTIEAKRHLIEHIQRRISEAHETSKVEFTGCTK